MPADDGPASCASGGSGKKDATTCGEKMLEGPGIKFCKVEGDLKTSRLTRFGILEDLLRCHRISVLFMFDLSPSTKQPRLATT